LFSKSNAINKQATNGQKMIRDLQNMCSFCARTIANLIHVNSPGGSTSARYKLKHWLHTCVRKLSLSL